MPGVEDFIDLKSGFMHLGISGRIRRVSGHIPGISGRISGIFRRTSGIFVRFHGFQSADSRYFWSDFTGYRVCRDFRLDFRDFRSDFKTYTPDFRSSWPLVANNILFSAKRLNK